MTESFLWSNFNQHPKKIQDELLRELKAALPKMTVREQCDQFHGAPSEVLISCLPDLVWEVQIYIWKNCLPVGDRKKARKHLSYEAEIKLGLRKKNQCLA